MLFDFHSFPYLIHKLTYRSIALAVFLLASQLFPFPKTSPFYTKILQNLRPLLC